MIILERYIGKNIIFAISIVLFALLGIDLFFYLVNELRYVGTGDYTLISLAENIVLTVPRKLYMLFPWAALIGTLLALGNLSRNSELVVMRTAAVSVHRIAWAAIKTGLIFVVIMFVVGELISPAAEKLALRKKTLALSKGQAIQTQFGTWVRNNDHFVHVGIIRNDHELQAVTDFTFNDNLEMQQVIYADIALKTQDGWELQNIRGTKIRDEVISILVSDNYNISQLVDTEILQSASIKHLDRLSIKRLWRIINSRVKNDLNTTDYQHAFWLKVVQPFACLVMIFLAVPFAFGPLRSASLGIKLIAGIILGFSFYTLNSIFGPLTSVIGIPPIVSALIPTVCFFILGSMLLVRVK